MSSSTPLPSDGSSSELRSGRSRPDQGGTCASESAGLRDAAQPLRLPLSHLLKGPLSSKLHGRHRSPLGFKGRRCRLQPLWGISQIPEERGGPELHSPLWNTRSTAAHDTHGAHRKAVSTEMGISCLGISPRWAHILALALTGCVTLGKSHNLYEPQFPLL